MNQKEESISIHWVKKPPLSVAVAVVSFKAVLLMLLMVHLGYNCIQNFHLGRYTV